MKRVNDILKHHKYNACLQQIRELEAERIFCGHNMAHFLDVARLAYIFNLEEGLGVDREWIYAAALLHDIGRHIQYLEKIPHQTASLPIADEILTETGFSQEEKKIILEAIAQHRNAGIREEKNLTGLLYRADKMSRSCFGCQAESQCDWSLEKKNMELKY